MSYEWNDPPPGSSEEFLRDALDKHAAVNGYEQVTSQVWRVDRHDVEPIRFFFQNVYIFGIADYEAVRNSNPDIRCIVTAGNWNNFTDDAEAAAAQDSVALFNFSGLFGALNRDGEDFYQHHPRE